MFTHARTPVGKRPRPSAPSTPYSPAPTPFSFTTTPSTPNLDTSASIPSYVTQQANSSIYNPPLQVPPSTPRPLTGILPITPLPPKPEFKFSHTTERYSLDTYGPLPNAVKNAIARLAGTYARNLVHKTLFFK